MPGVAGVMLTFDDFILGMEAFGEHMQPLMTTRKSVRVAPDNGATPYRIRAGAASAVGAVSILAQACQ